MKKDNEPSVPAQPWTAENHRLVKKISIAGVQFLENFRSVLASVDVGNHLRLIREPNNPHDCNAIRIDQDGWLKLGYVPRAENAELAEKMDEGVIFIGIITSLERHECKIEADLYERLQIPFPDFTSFNLKIEGSFSPSITCSFLARQRKFVYRENQPFDSVCNCTEITFSKEYWDEAWSRIQRCNFLTWESYYSNSCVLDGSQWRITVRRRNKKSLKIKGDNSYPEEWDTLWNFIEECLDLHKLKGNGKFYIQTLPSSHRWRVHIIY